MVYSIIKTIIRIGLRFFYKKIEVNGKENLVDKGPVIIAVNHPNTLMDPFVTAAQLSFQPGFIANAGIFKNPIANWMFTNLKVIPVYRQQDKDSNTDANANQNAFRKCFSFLANKGAIMIFPEGTSLHEMKLRPIKTGTARIALEFESLQNFNSHLTIIPIALNYTNPATFQSSVTVNVGKPIVVSDYKTSYEKDNVQGVTELTDRIKNELEQLMIISSNQEQETLFKQIQIIYKIQLEKKLKRSITDFEVAQAIAKALTFFEEHENERYKKLNQSMQAYFKIVHKLNSNTNLHTSSTSILDIMLQTSLLCICLPVYVLGLVTNYIPYILPSKLASIITKDITYRAPIMLLVGIVLFPLCYYYEIRAFHSYISSNILLLILFGISLPINGFVTLHYWNKLVEVKDRIILKVLKKNKLTEKLTQKQKEIITELEQMKDIYLEVIK